MDISKDIFLTRIFLLQKSLENNDVILIAPGSDLTYFTNISASTHERFLGLFVTKNSFNLILPKIEEKIYRECIIKDIIDPILWTDLDNPYFLMKKFLNQNTNLYVNNKLEALHLVNIVDQIKCKLFLAKSLIDPIRIRKDEYELEKLRLASAAIDRVQARMNELLLIGDTEFQSAEKIKRAIIDEGHDEVAFVIVGSGVNGADPHHSYSNKTINQDEIVVIDIGGKYQGYYSDCTRTYVMGSCTKEITEKYEILNTAQNYVKSLIKPGIEVSLLDETVRKILGKHNLEKYFTHRLGHGIGLDIHEYPDIITGNPLILEKGMTFSVEPGIYFPNQWGARIEDIIEVTDSGFNSLNKRSTELVVL